jgi:hypothetical protein
MIMPVPSSCDWLPLVAVMATMDGDTDFTI